MKKFSLFLSVLLLVAGVGGASASTITLITLDFNNGMSAQMTGGNLESVQSYAGLGTGSNVFSGNFLRNDSGGYGPTATSPVVPQIPTVLTLTGLPTHTSVSLGFLLAVMDSWDGSNPKWGYGYPYGPDYFNVRVVDGNNIWTFSETFSNFSRKFQSYIAPAGVELQWGTNDLGFNTWKDSAYDLGLDPVFQNIPHTADTLIVEWFASGAGWQGDNVRFGGTQDESWALDNVRVDLNGVPVSVPVPLPPSASLLGSGLLGLGLLGFRRMKKA